MTRLPIDRYTYPWGDAEDCPCSSGQKFVRCCKRGAKQLPYKKVPNLLPPGQATGYAHDRCYLSCTNDCSQGISREHYISNAILNRFQQLQVSGMPWQKPGETQALPAQALTANILCARHNSALSPLDDMAAKTFDALVAATEYAVCSKHPGRAAHYLVSGEAFEKWMLKVAAGIYFGGLAQAEGQKVRDLYTFPLDAFVSVLRGESLAGRAGLYLTQNTGVVQHGQLGVSPLLNVATDQLAGVSIMLSGIKFECVFQSPDIPHTHKLALGARHRPSMIDFNGPARDARVVFTWRTNLNEVRRFGLAVQR